MKSTEREVIDLKEIILGLKESVDRLAKEMKKSVASRKKEELGTSDVSIHKTKEKREELEMQSTAKPGQAEHFFEINDLVEMEKVKVIAVNFAQEEVSCFCRSNNRKKVMFEEDLKQRLFEHFKPTSKGSERKLGVDVFFTNEEEDFEDGFETNIGANRTIELKTMEVGDEMEITLRAIHGIEEMGPIKGRGVNLLINSEPPKSLAIIKGDQPIVLRGDSTLNTIECSLKKLMKAGEEEQGSRIEVEEEEKTENKSREGGDKEWLSMIQALLKQYDNIFDISHWKKCVAGHSKIQHLGQWITQRGWKPMGRRTELRRFVKKYGDMATPPFCQSIGFTQCHTTFVSEIDASGFRLDVILAQTKMKQTDLHQKELNF
ncbi:retrotransposon protein [Cucumis melo var. makuwa]|uniref:Retrotransposon protein n=1 Tax=Cucumis melo var. makuwa TaxID=1194695 RepID=A0A5D3E430_CUCMM|nr:retrotransposon protein [Cucumis melo var. makuwa]